MAKQFRKSAPTVKQSPNPSRSEARKAGPAFLQNISLQSRLIFVFAMLLYANTLRNGFVYDDGFVITENRFTTEGFKGIWGIMTHDAFSSFSGEEGVENLVSGGRYRPLSVVLFAVLYQFFKDNPIPFHLVTILLFAFCCAVLYRTLIRLIAPNGEEGSVLVVWVASLLFVAHPIHTEVVANIKSCDEILALLGSVGALHFTLRAWDEKQNQWCIWAGICMLLACLSKENAVVYALLIPLALWFFRKDATEQEPKPSLWKASIPALAALALFLGIRGAVLPWTALSSGQEPLELMNNPFLKYENNQWVHFTASEKFATIFYTLWKYVQLLFLPHPLTHDYYPRHIDIMSFGNPFVLLALALYGFMGFWIIRGIMRRDTTAFALLLYVLPLGLVSNLLFPIGTNMSERFLFMPSVGFCLLIGLLWMRYIGKDNKLAWQVLGLVLLLFSVKTISRNAVWVSNESLFLTDSAVSENSVKVQLACANVLLERGKTEATLQQQQKTGQDAIGRINRAMQFYPECKTAIILRGAIYAMMQQYPEAIADYRKALEQAPDVPKRKEMLAFTLRQAGLFYGQQQHDLEKSLKNLNESWQINPQDPETARLLGVAYMVQGNKDEALSWYQKGEAVAANDTIGLWEIGIAYGNLGMPDKARELQEKAMRLDPGIAQKAQAGK